jgi:hypothetical protein
MRPSSPSNQKIPANSKNHKIKGFKIAQKFFSKKKKQFEIIIINIYFFSIQQNKICVLIRNKSDVKSSTI